MKKILVILLIVGLIGVISYLIWNQNINKREEFEMSKYSHKQIGDVIIWPNESHIAMIDYNLYQNGTYTKKFAAHTTDRKQYLYSASNGYAHYKVSCWRWTP